MTDTLLDPRQVQADLGSHPALQALGSLSGEGSPLWLVGGALRDALLGRPVTDFDFATPGDPTALARRFAGSLGGSWFILDHRRSQSRVVQGKGPAAVTFDFAPLRAPDLAPDLLLRDFTINALALPMLPGGIGSLVDPLDGLGDLERRVLRCCSPGVLGEDPLRILKGVRHLVQLGLEIDASTRQLMAQAAPGLDAVAAERIGREIALLFRGGETARGLRLLQACDALQRLFGSALDPAQVERGNEALVGADRAVAALAEGGIPHDLWDAVVGGDFTRGNLLRLAAWLRGCGLRDAARASWRLSPGRTVLRVLDSLLRLSESRLADLEDVAPRPRSRALWAADLGPDPVAAIALLKALGGDARRNRLENILQDFLAEDRRRNLKPLLDGEEVQSLLDLPPGPRLGGLLEKLRRAEISGRVSSRSEAENFLKSLEIERN